MDKYEKIRLLGKGTFGKAWLVREVATQALLVAKEIKVENKQDIEDAMVEARIMGKVEHVNIVRFKEVFRVSPKLITIVMEFCDDGDIADKIARRKFVHQYFEEDQVNLIRIHENKSTPAQADQQVIRWLVQIVQALYHLHHRGMMHRDIKSANLFVTTRGFIKLGDFGVAKVLQRNADRMSARTTRTPVGTPMYMSPELCHGKPYSSKADMWALGCVLFELCALRPAFVAQSMDGLMAKIKQGEHDRNMPAHFSPDLCQLISALLSLEERARPSAGDVLRMSFLKPYLETSPHTLFTRGQLPPERPVTPAPPAPPEILVIAETLRRAGHRSTVSPAPAPLSRNSTPTSSGSEMDLLREGRPRRDSRSSLAPSISPSNGGRVSSPGRNGGSSPVNGRINSPASRPSDSPTSRPGGSPQPVSAHSRSPSPRRELQPGGSPHIRRNSSDSSVGSSIVAIDRGRRPSGHSSGEPSARRQSWQSNGEPTSGRRSSLAPPPVLTPSTPTLGLHLPKLT